MSARFFRAGAGAGGVRDRAARPRRAGPGIRKTGGMDDPDRSRPLRRPEAPPAVEAAGVEVRASPFDDAPVLLHATDLVVRRGEAVALTGVNGAGKTTLLRAIAGAVPISAGRLLVLGREPGARSAEARREVNAMLDGIPWNRKLTVSEHLVLVLRTWGRSQADAVSSVARDLEGWGVGRIGGAFPGELSSGQRQMASLIAALARPARLLLLDEPEQRLDAARRDRLAGILAERAAGGCAVVFATHDARVAERAGARIAVVRRPGDDGADMDADADSMGADDRFDRDRGEEERTARPGAPE